VTASIQQTSSKHVLLITECMPGRVKSSVNESDWSVDHWRAERLSVYVMVDVGFARWTSLTVDFLAKLRAVFADADRSEHCIIIDARSATRHNTVHHVTATEITHIIFHNQAITRIYLMSRLTQKYSL